jgi:transcriptional accessory protein Tex/SPT6
LQDGFVKNVADVVKVGDTIKCRVLSVDVAGKRLALTRKGMGFGDAGGGGRRSAPQARVEEEEDGECTELCRISTSSSRAAAYVNGATGATAAK